MQKSRDRKELRKPDMAIAAEGGGKVQKEGKISNRKHVLSNTTEKMKTEKMPLAEKSDK